MERLRDAAPGFLQHPAIQKLLWQLLEQTGARVRFRFFKDLARLWASLASLSMLVSITQAYDSIARILGL